MKFISLFRRNHNQGSPSGGVNPYQQPSVTMESAVFPPNNKQAQETDKRQQEQEQEQERQKEVMDSHGAMAIGLSPIDTIDRCDNMVGYAEELEKLRMEVHLLKVPINV